MKRYTAAEHGSPSLYSHPNMKVGHERIKNQTPSTSGKSDFKRERLCYYYQGPSACLQHKTVWIKWIYTSRLNNKVKNRIQESGPKPTYHTKCQDR